MSSPSQIGPYEIQRELGRGGMGVVYLGRDPSLLRAVAVKVLPESLLRDAERMARFRQEARLLASMSHPNVAVVYSLDQTAAGALYLAMEYIEGESLADRLRHGALPVPDALRVCRGIAEGIEAAHARGIIHRDLKPANVMLGANGHVKVLDFGLARRLEAEARQIEAQATRAIEVPTGSLTGTGEVLGTPGYFSPEQARSLPYDHRADLFAFGCLMFECLTGRRAFPGRTAFDALAAVLRDEPDWDLLPAELPPAARDALARCLCKDPEKRPHAMHEVVSVLEGSMEGRPSGLTPRRHNLPRELTTFVGRARELVEVADLLRSTSLLTLTGAGGSGKTRLALRAAADALPDHPDGVWLVELASVSDPLLVPDAVASALGLREVPGKPVVELLVEELQSRRLLLILDNCEHLVRACSDLLQRLRLSCPELRVLATSREVLGLPGEVPYRVPSLSLPESGDAAGELLESEACRLFVERARASFPGFRAGEAEAPAIARICRRLDGIPLAIELAAARARVLTAEQIESRLDDRFRLLTGGSRASLERHQTLRATLDWSYALLTPEEQRWLRALSVFVGGCSLEAALAVAGGIIDGSDAARSEPARRETGASSASGAAGVNVAGPDADTPDEFDALEFLSRLVDKSLVIPDSSGGESRYRMLEMARQYALERCEQSGEGTALRDRHLRWCLRLVERARPHTLGGPEQKRWLERLDVDHENCQAALRWCEGMAGGSLPGLKLGVSLAQFWYLRGHGVLGRTYLMRALEHDERESLGSGDRPAEAERERRYWRAAALNAAAHFLTAEGNYDEARRLVEQAVEIRRRLDSPIDLARSLFTLGANHWNSGRFDEARKANEEALAIGRALGHREMIAAVLNALGAGAYQQGDLAAARSHFEESLALRRELQDRPNVAMVLGNLGILLSLQGELAAARRRQEEALAMQREMGNPEGVLAVLENLGNTLLECGEPDRAAEAYREALDLAVQLGHKPRIAGVYVRLAMFHLRQGHPHLAVAPLLEALREYRSLGSPSDAAEAISCAACVLAGAGEAVTSARLFGAAAGESGPGALLMLAGDRALIERHRDVARRVLGDERYAAAAEEGRGADFGRLVDEAMTRLQSTGRPGPE